MVSTVLFLDLTLQVHLQRSEHVTRGDAVDADAGVCPLNSK